MRGIGRRRNVWIFIPPVIASIAVLGHRLGAGAPRADGAARPAARLADPRLSAPPDGRSVMAARTEEDLLPLTSACSEPSSQGRAVMERPVPFAPGEVLEYDITRVPYLVSGTATAMVLEKRPGCGSVVYRIAAEGQPVPLLAKLYRLTYRVATVLDAGNLLPYAGVVYSEEGRRRRFKLTRFDPLSRMARFEMTTTTRMTKELPPRAGAHDPLSLLYALRTFHLPVGQQMTVPVADSGRWYTVTVTTEGRDHVATGLGDLPAWRLGVDARDENGRRPFRRLTLWLTETERRLPAKLVAELKFGPFTFTLRSARP